MTLSTPLGDFGAPPDAMAWGALGLAVVSAAAAFHPGLLRGKRLVSTRAAVAALAVAAAALSAAYVAVYLRGGPRIVDATTYYLQARALAEGHVSFHVPSPTASFRGRFLVATPDGHALSGIFPPGYPAALALGFLAGAPMLVGPIIAAALVVVTHALALRLFRDRDIALLSAALSAACAVLRYHTADTMSHGLSALLLACAVWSAMGAGRASAWLSGVTAGWLVATRPVTGLLGIALVAAVGARSPRRAWPFVAGVVGPVLLLFVEQRAATGAWLRSSQSAYYALADGPPGCFRYGFGSGIGCVFEHGDFVAAHLAHGYGFAAAAGTTLRRLKMHLADAGNTELFAPLLVYAGLLARREARVRVPVAAVVGAIAVYAPFYFDGNYPGGGARFYADVLPFEHVLLSFVLVRLRFARLALPTALAGFALHTVYDHLRLANREGGRPMFETAALRRAGVTRGLVFVDTDHGFDLGYDPDALDPRRDVVVARRRGDAHDVMLWERLGRPPAFFYELSLTEHDAPPRIVVLPLERSTQARFEAEAEWPPLQVVGGYAVPTFPPCASAHRALAVRPTHGKRAHIRVELPYAEPGKYRIDTGWVTPPSGRARLEVTFAGVPWTARWSGPPATCKAMKGPVVELGRDVEYVEITTESAIELDYLETVPVPVGPPAGRQNGPLPTTQKIP